MKTNFNETKTFEANVTTVFDNEVEYEAFKLFLKKFEIYWKNHQEKQNQKVFEPIEQKKKRGCPRKLNIKTSILTEDKEIMNNILSKYGQMILNNYLNMKKYNGQIIADEYISTLKKYGYDVAKKYFDKKYKQITKKSFKCKNPKTRFTGLVKGYATKELAMKNKKSNEYLYSCRVLIHRKVDNNFPVRYYCVNKKKENILSYVRSCWFAEYDYDEKAVEEHYRMTGKHYGSHVTAKRIC